MRARSPVGVPPRLSPKGLTIPMAQLQARLPGTWRADLRPGVIPRRPPAPVPVQRCTSRPGHNAGGLMPKPPGSGVQIRPRAPRPRSDGPACLRTTSFTWSEIWGLCNVNGDAVSRDCRLKMLPHSRLCPDHRRGCPQTGAGMTFAYVRDIFQSFPNNWGKKGRRQCR